MHYTIPSGFLPCHVVDHCDNFLLKDNQIRFSYDMDPTLHHLHNLLRNIEIFLEVLLFRALNHFQMNPQRLNFLHCCMWFFPFHAWNHQQTSLDILHLPLSILLSHAFSHLKNYLNSNHHLIFLKHLSHDRLHFLCLLDMWNLLPYESDNFSLLLHLHCSFLHRCLLYCKYIFRGHVFYHLKSVLHILLSNHGFLTFLLHQNLHPWKIHHTMLQVLYLWNVWDVLFRDKYHF